MVLLWPGLVDSWQVLGKNKSRLQLSMATAQGQ